MVRLVNQDKPILVFAGYVLPDDSNHSEELFQVKLAKDFVVTLPVKIREFFTFMATPQYREDVYIAIANSGGNISDVDRMLETDLIRIVPPGHNDLSLYALSDLKLVPIGFKVKLPKGESSSHVYVGHSEESTNVCSISPLLASVLWDAEENEDFPDAVRRLGVEGGWRDDIAIRLALSDLDSLLSHGLARWENLLELKQRKQQKVLEEVSGTVSVSSLNPLDRIKKFLMLR